MSKIGFGTYRVSHRSKDHKEALLDAIKHGVGLIDTSANYTDGDSETLIGEVLKEVESKPIIVTKAGYVQGKNLDALEEILKTHPIKEDVVEFSTDLKHCIHPVFLGQQLEQSLSRLGLEKLDVLLLHNPEYYLKKEGSNKEEYYSRIQKAFMFLEDKVREGKIGSYGISSNTFIDPKDDHESTDLEVIIDIAKKINPSHSLKYIQFPLNLIELGALERQFSGKHLIELAKESGIQTLINRPFNAITDKGLLRLAEYPESAYLQEKNPDELFNNFITPLVKKWEEIKDEVDEGLFELPLIQQLTKVWHTQPSQDAVDQIFFGHVFPFVARVWGRDLTSDESQSFYDWYELASEYARMNMHERALSFKNQAMNSGLLFESEKPLTQMCIDKYETFGVDYILVGMRSTKYVDDLKKYF
jgi:aryl-alcohol dehydrogenase-like predicted oxidoreductase